MRPILLLACLLAALLALSPVQPTAAQTPVDCGIVDGISYPVDGVTENGDDFGIYRGKFGGRHTGADIAFYRRGDPVFAVARGRVTYADPDGWDTEKGVVIIEHRFPDGSTAYSLYGHMEPIGDYYFPGVGQCVEMGDIVGAVGSPSLSAPHLHFEIRTFLPDDGGPGYWDTNPAEAGWLHPLDFVRRWQIELQNRAGYRPYVSHVTGLISPIAPPLVTPDGGLITAGGNRLEGIGPDSALRWRMELSNTVAGTLLLPDGRVLVRLADDTMLLLQDGRSRGLWMPDLSLTGAPIALGDAVAFFTSENALVAYTPDGVLLWGTPPLGDRIASYTVVGDRIAVSTRPYSPELPAAWHVIGRDGQILYQVAPASVPFAALSPDGQATLLAGDTLYHISADFIPTPLARLPYDAGRSTALIRNAAGNTLVFLGLDESLLLSYDPSGALLWQTTVPGIFRQPPLLATDESCLLYVLGSDGTLYVLDSRTGSLLGQAQLYAGGSNGYPGARLLEVLPGGQVRFGAGYLTVITLDGYALAGLEPGTCPPPG